MWLVIYFVITVFLLPGIESGDRRIFGLMCQNNLAEFGCCGPWLGKVGSTICCSV